MASIPAGGRQPHHGVALLRPCLPSARGPLVGAAAASSGAAAVLSRGANHSGAGKCSSQGSHRTGKIQLLMLLCESPHVLQLSCISLEAHKV